MHDFTLFIPTYSLWKEITMGHKLKFYIWIHNGTLLPLYLAESQLERYSCFSMLKIL